MRYAVEVEKAGSFSKAAERLYMNQPALSKAIRELEDSFGMAIFNRTSKGVVPTEAGAEFLKHAENILSQIEEMERLYNRDKAKRRRLYISAPRASYTSLAFCEFAKKIPSGSDIDLSYHETSAKHAMNNVARGVDDLAVVRCQKIYEKNFLSSLAEKELVCRPVYEFTYELLMSKDHPLADKEKILPDMLIPFTEIVHGDSLIPFMSAPMARQVEMESRRPRRITVYDRGSQYELLKRLTDAYMWVSPTHKEILERFKLCERECFKRENECRDLLIYRKGYRFSEDETLFIETLSQTVERFKKISY